jgi:transcriptional regulator with XRE-family HTH domain
MTESGGALTPFGKALRKLRIDRGWLMKDMAKGLDVVPSFLSGIETGRKAIPPGFADRVVQWAGLDESQAAELSQLAAISRRKFEIPTRNDFTAGDLETAALLARFGELPREEREQLGRLIRRKLPCKTI